MFRGNIIELIKRDDRGIKAYVPVMLLLSFTNAAVTVARLFFVKAVIDFVLSDAFLMSQLLTYLMLFFFFGVLEKILNNSLLHIYCDQFKVSLKNHTMSGLYHKILNIDLIHYNNKDFYRMVGEQGKAEGGSVQLY